MKVDDINKLQREINSYLQIVFNQPLIRCGFGGFADADTVIIDYYYGTEVIHSETMNLYGNKQYVQEYVEVVIAERYLPTIFRTLSYICNLS